MRITDEQFNRTLNWIFGGVLGCIILVGFLLYLAITAYLEPPSFIEPKIVATGKKYEPKPWYPEKKVPEQLKELAKYERVETITR